MVFALKLIHINWFANNIILMDRIIWFHFIFFVYFLFFHSLWCFILETFITSKSGECETIQNKIKWSALFEWTRRPFEFVKIHHNDNGFYVFGLIKKNLIASFFSLAVIMVFSFCYYVYESPFSICDSSVLNMVACFFFFLKNVY